MMMMMMTMMMIPGGVVEQRWQAQRLRRHWLGVH